MTKEKNNQDPLIDSKGLIIEKVLKIKIGETQKKIKLKELL